MTVCNTRFISSQPFLFSFFSSWLPSFSFFSFFHLGVARPCPCPFFFSLPFDLLGRRCLPLFFFFFLFSFWVRFVLFFFFFFFWMWFFFMDMIFLVVYHIFCFNWASYFNTNSLYTNSLLYKLTFFISLFFHS